jgi:hypothetical protein
MTVYRSALLFGIKYMYVGAAFLHVSEYKNVNIFVEFKVRVVSYSMLQAKTKS